jgi:predicted nucleic acid-binding protein
MYDKERRRKPASLGRWKNLFLESPRVHVLAVEDDTAEYYAKVFFDLKKREAIPTNDMWVAASAMQHGLWLATGDEHFSDVEGLLLFALRGQKWQR